MPGQLAHLEFHGYHVRRDRSRQAGIPVGDLSGNVRVVLKPDAVGLPAGRTGVPRPTPGYGCREWADGDFPAKVVLDI